MSRDNVIQGYKVLYEKLDEMYLDLKVKQLKELEKKLDDVWSIIERRKK